MKKSRLGCLTPFGLMASLITLLVTGGIYAIQGGTMFSPGALSAISGPMLGGVTSHAELGGRCISCHTAPWNSDRITDRCLDCHTQVRSELTDPSTLHGRLANPPEQGDCRHCHTEHHGPDAILTHIDNQNFPHDLTGFSLLAHTELPDGQPFECIDCHTESLARLEPEICVTCHEQLDIVYLNRHIDAFGQECLPCHDGVDIFGDFSHDLTRFALSGEHTQVACQICHPGATSRQELQDTPTDCSSCHGKNDPHRGQLGSNCAECHTPQGWKPATFDHSRTKFPLTGAHQSVSCDGCHISHTYKDTPADCFNCHNQDDPHGGQFGTGCKACHVTDRWDNVSFDHSNTNFPLTGVHSSLSCMECHSNIFKGTPTRCVACHTDPIFHFGLFGADCSACHNSSGWLPVSYNGPHSFPQAHGDATSCRNCHPSTLTGWTCYTCHDQADIAQEHTEEGISDFSNCLQCHPDGKEGDDHGTDDIGDDD